MRLLIGTAILGCALWGQSAMPRDPTREGLEVNEPLRVSESLYVALGFGNTILARTSVGNVIIDTSMPPHAARHKKMLDEVAPGAVKYVIFTHGHGDHTSGMGLWKQAGTRVIAQRNHLEFRHYQARLAGFFRQRNAAQFGQIVAANSNAWRPETAGNYPARIEADVLFDDRYEFELGGVKFELYHTPGETEDHLTVRIPAWNAVLPGDNFYGSFPNLYTLRGTKPRWALDYVQSLDRIIGWEPEMLIPSHGRPVQGKGEIRKALEKYRDAILHVHDATVAGMNAGKDVFTLMREVRLPPHLDVGEGYGTVAWSVRGIYEGYVGWFDGNAASMFEVPPRGIYPELTQLAGGADTIAARAREIAGEGRLVEALHMTDVALAGSAGHREALRVRVEVLERLLKESKNSNERGWLNHALVGARAGLKAAGE